MVTGSTSAFSRYKIAGSAYQVDDDSELVAWAERIAVLGVGRSIPELIVRLEKLRASQLDLDTRYRILRSIKRPLLEAAARIPPSGRVSLPDRRDRAPRRDVVQRLYEAMVGNLQVLLADLDRAQRGLARQASGQYGAERHRWIVRNLFRFIERDLLYAVHSGSSWPPGIWQSLHDLFVYLVVRGNVRLSGQGSQPVTGLELNAELLYKRLVMIGLAADLCGSNRIDKRIARRFDDLANASRLVESDGLVGEYGLILVEVGQDAPARLKAEPLTDPFRGWVLRVPLLYRRSLPNNAGLVSQEDGLDDSIDALY